MRMFLLFMTIAGLFTLTACGSVGNWKVDVLTSSPFHEGKPTTLTMQIKAGNTPVSGLQVQADLEMKNMDHGTIDVSFHEKEKGTYTGEALLPMNGDWVGLITVNDGKNKQEKEIDVKVE
ncbi:FixH family protein [Aneurinibacillus tyrosinisolvens]|uniref:FixH family protein n=1 Tax=Aneurinibacillus tyrosinisolvens TaxID=1443435 RepID=UPI00063EE184|nr:FixH family protein [Aneurinibacillus tyrosinisolvens]